MSVAPFARNQAMPCTHCIHIVQCTNLKDYRNISINDLVYLSPAIHSDEIQSGYSLLLVESILLASIPFHSLFVLSFNFFIRKLAPYPITLHIEFQRKATFRLFHSCTCNIRQLGTFRKYILSAAYTVHTQ